MQTGMKAAAGMMILLTLMVLMGLVGLSVSELAPLNIHILAHSHCDPGWLTTFEGYYQERVQHILSRVVEELERGPNRTFTWAEMYAILMHWERFGGESFFSRWYDDPNNRMRERVQALVKSGRFEFVAGGWVQNDEANANYDIVVDQVTEGHEYIWKNFGVRPRIAWQIDPFGHSSLTPSLFAEMGFDALVINRIHHQSKNVFKQAKHMEFVWRGSHSLKQRSDMFTHVLHKHYSAPEGFDWEEGAPSIDSNSVGHRAQEFARQMRARGDVYTTSHILVTWGDDFKFSSANHQFSNMDRLMEHINQHFSEFKLNMFYSTPERYFRELHEEAESKSLKFPLYVGDFFPYADNEDSYWTGYYTTRPKIKSESRRTDGVLASAEASFALARALAQKTETSHDWGKDFAGLLQGRRDASLVQHHDGITGTAKSWVGADYLKRLSDATAHSYGILSFAVPILLRRDGGVAPELSSEHNLIRLESGKSYPVVVFNGQGWKRSEFQWVRISIPGTQNIVVLDGQGNPVPSQIMPALDGADESDSEARLYFLAQVPALGASTYFVTVSKEKHQGASETYKSLRVKAGEKPDEAAVTIANEQYEVSMSLETLMVGKVKNLETELTVQVKQDLLRYSTYNSGAYIFRSTGPAQAFEHNERKANILKGKYIQQFGVNLGRRRLIVTLYSTQAKDTSRVIEQSWNINAGSGEEVITRYSTDIESGGRWFTDNALEMIPRTRKDDKTPHKNYYPCPSTAYINDDDSVQFTILTANAMGVSSLQDGEIEIMMHRHLQQDDGRGLAEGVNDDSTVPMTTWLIVDSPDATSEIRRHLSVLLNHPTNVLQARSPMTVADWSKRFHWAYSALSAPLPDNLHLMSLRVRDHEDKETVAMRLLHTQEAGETNALSVPVSIDAVSIFAGFHLEEVRETLLSFTGNMAEILAKKWKWANSGKSDLASIGFKDFDGESGQNTNEKGVFISKAALDAANGNKGGATRRSLLAVESTSLQLSPREIKAFLLKLSAGGTRLVDAAALPVSSKTGADTDDTDTDESNQAENEPQVSGEQNHNIPPSGKQEELPRRPPHGGKVQPKPAKRNNKKPARTTSSRLIPTWLIVTVILMGVVFWGYRQLRGNAVRGGVRGLFRGTVPVDASKLK